MANLFSDVKFPRYFRVLHPSLSLTLGAGHLWVLMVA